MGLMPRSRPTPAPHPPDGRDEVIEMLDEVVAALQENTDRAQRAMERAEVIRRCRREGLSYTEIAAEGYGPLVIKLVTENLQNLVSKGSRLRRAHARALYAEGLTLQQIAAMYGVTHQRISAIINSSDHQAGARHSL